VTDNISISKKVPAGSVVYIRYLDHVLYRNMPEPLEEATERETIGWLIGEREDVLSIGNDRTLDKLPYSRGKGSGFALVKSCLIEVRSPLQNALDWPLIYRNPNIINAESALQTTKRKIQPKLNKEGKPWRH
jgi:hypothetical protein